MAGSAAVWSASKGRVQDENRTQALCFSLLRPAGAQGRCAPGDAPQGFGGQVGSGLEDLGWNDMGFEPPKPAEADRDTEHDAFGDELTPHPLRNPLAALTPVGSPVHDQQAEITDRLNVADDADEIDEDYDETAELVDGDELPEIVLAAANEPFRNRKRSSRSRSRGQGYGSAGGQGCSGCRRSGVAPVAVAGGSPPPQARRCRAVVAKRPLRCGSTRRGI